MKPVEPLRKKYWRQNFFFFGGTEMIPNLASEAHILNISKTSTNEHVNQEWCETSRNVFAKIIKALNFDLF